MSPGVSIPTSRFLEPLSVMVMTMSTGGRPSKGDRYAAKTRLPRPVADAVWEIHNQTGAAVSDIIARFVALGLGMPEQAPALPESLNQEELQLKTA